jgi:mono/diheme cytochrome c family protein
MRIHALVLVAVGCAGSEAATVGGGNGSGGNPTPHVPGPWDTGFPLPAPPRNHGDPRKGEWLLLNGDYMSCGLPYKLWSMPVASSIIQSVLGAGRPPMPGRSGENEHMPYTINVFNTVDGAQVMNLNCLECHGGYFDGKLIVGLGDPTRDFTDGLIGNLPVDLIQSWMLPPLLFTDAERASTDRVLHTARALKGMTAMRTVGNNPADSLTQVLVKHRDVNTLAWSDAELFDLKFYDQNGQEVTDSRFTVDPPPWWRAHKKNALFYNGMTRGPHRGTMEAANTICVDNVTEAARIDAEMEDIQAYVESIRAPRYPRAIDNDLAAHGHDVFVKSCAGCHGTYAKDRAEADTLDTYPSLLVPLTEVETDPVIASVGDHTKPDLFPIFNGSFYGKITELHPGEPFNGYMPPPLDGIWATAPFLHNGSVPTIEALVNSKLRPKYWKRVDYDSTHFDEQAIGWPFIEVPYNQANAPESERKYIYDTTLWSQGNGGHTYGDALSDGDRRAVLEYLKTL